MRWRRPEIWLLMGLLLASPAASPAQEATPPDSTTAAPSDTTAAEQSYLDALEARLRAKRAQEAAAGGGEAAPGGLFHDCVNAPEAGVKANVTRVNYFGNLANKVQVAGGGSLTDTYGYSYDSYRRQDRTVENRNANATYLSGEGQDPYGLLPVILRLEASTNWSEDVTVNTAGSRNTKRSQTRRAGVSATRSRLVTGPLIQNLTAGWYYNNITGVNLGEASEQTDTETTGAVRTGIPFARGLALATRLYGSRRIGDNALAGFDSPTKTTGDTLGIGGYYNRGGATGKLVVSQVNFDRTYLDYRRDANGLIDTTDVPDGAEKIVRELEERDAWQLNWDNKVALGRFNFESKLAHTYEKQQYNQSLVGAKERSSDTASLTLAFPVGNDSLSVTYKYEWTWDDQRFLNATASRGRQYLKKREVAFGWVRHLFRHTDLKGRYRTELSQDIAQNRFNENDRDRLTEEASLELESHLSPRFYASLEGSYLRKDDIAIRSTLSANNNVKRSYEVSPQYTWTISDKVSLQQTFRMYIQYQDYLYDALESVRKEDTFNKRGNVATKVTYDPNDRIEIIVKHDLNRKNNGTRAATDLAGRESYRRDSNQSINRIEFGFTYDLTDEVSLQTATFRTEDETERFSGTTSSLTANRSGELWVGAVLDQSFGPRDNPVSFKGRIKRYLAYGPNVTDTSNDYWEADLLLKWAF
ncbi:MAG: hypothetical protein R3D98_09475 [Candidatus Krumholzibacteriia bacterium]